jgi:hypothetical protein
VRDSAASGFTDIQGPVALSLTATFPRGIVRTMFMLSGALSAMLGQRRG